MSVVSLQKVHRLLREAGYVNANGRDPRRREAEYVYSARARASGVEVCPWPGRNWSIPRRRQFAELLCDTLRMSGVSGEIDSASLVFVPYLQPAPEEVGSGAQAPISS